MAFQLKISLGKEIRRWFDLHSQIQLIAIQAGILGMVLAFGYCFGTNKVNYLAALIGLLSNSLMLTQNYHGHNSFQRLYLGVTYSLICALMFGLATLVSQSLVYSSLLLLLLLPLLAILNAHQLINSFVFYLAYAYILGLGFVTTNWYQAAALAAYFAIGSLLIATGGFIRLWVRHKLFSLNETIDFVKYALISKPQPKHLVFTITLTVAVVVSNIIAYWLKLAHGYWLPLTTLLIMRNEHGVTLTRSKDRLLGSMLGIVLAYLLLANSPSLLQCLSVAILFYLTIITFNSHYLIFCIAITLLILDIILLNEPGVLLLKVRLVTTTLAVVLVISASFIVNCYLGYLVKRKHWTVASSNEINCN